MRTSMCAEDSDVRQQIKMYDKDTDEYEDVRGIKRMYANSKKR